MSRRVGILGGGQLGSLLASAVHDLGAEVFIYEPDPAAPACARFKHVTNAAWTDKEALARFFSEVDVVTYEMEHIDTSALKEVAAASTARLTPSCHVLETAQDRAREKDFLRSSGLPHVDFAVVRGRAELLRTAAAFGFPFILKTLRGGYDGKGQFFVASQTDLESLAAIFGNEDPCVLEEVIDLTFEASCIVGRSGSGADVEEVVFPIFENVHTGHILDLTLVPARIPESLRAAIAGIALDAARALDVQGLLTTEFFVTRRAEQRSRGTVVDGYHVYVNELAPRPHNSGHVTRNACTLSQFDVLARILLGIPVSTPALVGPGSFCMGNLLGDVWIAQGARRPAPSADDTHVDGPPELDLSVMRRFPEVIDVVFYGKREVEARRKMGHFVTAAPDAVQAAAAAKAFRVALTSAAARST
ncbi:MAG: 5-(carboxyamino)imidazole ribonucleotide synthase [Myxococcaceae bacterium]|nr:5-(carboxyamino)imidazole ribonucleotide synthase [Myxococcaceae bacterium]